MNKIDYRRLELKLRRIVEKRLREGWTVQSGLFRFVDEFLGACCIIGAIEANEYTHEMGLHGRASHRLRVGFDTVLNLEDGFEQRKTPDFYISDSRARAIGERIRRDYCEWQ